MKLFLDLAYLAILLFVLWCFIIRFLNLMFGLNLVPKLPSLGKLYNSKLELLPIFILIFYALIRGMWYVWSQIEF